MKTVVSFFKRLSFLRGGGRERGGRATNNLGIQLQGKMCLESDFPKPRASQDSTVLPAL